MWGFGAQHPLIDNPEFEDDEEVYLLPPLKFVGFELWQVKSGTIFDNILVTDDVEYAARFAEETWGASKDKEKEMLDAVRAEEEKKRKEVKHATSMHVLLLTEQGVLHKTVSLGNRGVTHMHVWHALACMKA